MNILQVIVMVDFSVDPEERHTKTWKRLGGAAVERLIEVPEPILGPGNLLELVLDGQSRSLRIEALRWNEAKQMIRVLTVPEAPLAVSLDGQGIRAWRPWVAKRAAAGFMERCKAAGWRIAGAEEPRIAKPGVDRGAVDRAAGDRKEPTL